MMRPNCKTERCVIFLGLFLIFSQASNSLACPEEWNPEGAANEATTSPEIFEEKVRETDDGSLCAHLFPFNQSLVYQGAIDLFAFLSDDVTSYSLYVKHASASPSSEWVLLSEGVAGSGIQRLCTWLTHHGYHDGKYKVMINATDGTNDTRDIVEIKIRNPTSGPHIDIDAPEAYLLSDRYSISVNATPGSSPLYNMIIILEKWDGQGHKDYPSGVSLEDVRPFDMPETNASNLRWPITGSFILRPEAYQKTPITAVDIIVLAHDVQGNQSIALKRTFAASQIIDIDIAVEEESVECVIRQTVDTEPTVILYTPVIFGELQLTSSLKRMESGVCGKDTIYENSYVYDLGPSSLNGRRAVNDGSFISVHVGTTVIKKDID